jgi:hypothetical protein
MVARPYFSGSALLSMATVILAAVPAGTARADRGDRQAVYEQRRLLRIGRQRQEHHRHRSALLLEPIEQRLVICAGVQQRQRAVWRVQLGGRKSPQLLDQQRRHPFRRLPDQAAKRRLRPSRDLLHGLARAFVELSAVATHARVRLSGQHRRRQQSRTVHSAKLRSAWELRIGRAEHGLQHDLRLKRRSLD